MNPEPEDIQTGTDNVRRSGLWLVQAALRVLTVTGNVRLDFREAKMTADQTDIEIDSGTGAIDLILPPNASADISGLTTGTGTVHDKVPNQRLGGSHFVVHGTAGTGSVRIAYSPRVLGIF